MASQRPQSSSASRLTAGASGFLNLSQYFEPDPPNTEAERKVAQQILGAATNGDVRRIRY
jgi:hypothetical protein